MDLQNVWLRSWKKRDGLRVRAWWILLWCGLVGRRRVIGSGRRLLLGIKVCPYHQCSSQSTHPAVQEKKPQSGAHASARMEHSVAHLYCGAYRVRDGGRLWCTAPRLRCLWGQATIHDPCVVMDATKPSKKRAPNVRTGHRSYRTAYAEQCLWRMSGRWFTQRKKLSPSSGGT